MKNLWGIRISQEKIKSPKSIFEEQSKYLSEMTNNIIYLEVANYKENTLPGFENLKKWGTDNKPSSIVNFQVNVRSTILEDYGFNILTYSHDISLYPISIDLNPDISAELLGSDNEEESIHLNSENEFIEFISKVFSSKKIEMVINSMLSMSK